MKCIYFTTYLIYPLEIWICRIMVMLFSDAEVSEKSH